MKILQVNCVYGKGSTGKITADLHSQLLKNGIKSVVCYGRGKLVTEPGVYKTCSELYSKFNNLLSRITGVMYGGCLLSTNRLISIIKKEKPDIVHLQCINGYFVNIYRIVSWLKKHGVKTVLTLHAEFMYTGGCGHALECDRWMTSGGCTHYKCPKWRSETHSLFFDRTGTMWKRMKRAFDGFEDNLIITSVSPWLMERAKISPILRDKNHSVVLNGLDTGIFHVYSTDEIRKKHGITNEKIIFHAAPFFTDDADGIKGGKYVIELARRFKEQNVKFIVAAAYKGDIKIPENMILLGSVTDQTELAKYYSAADLTVIASKAETFSMICAESLCCGTPVVGFKAGGPETISLPEYSEFVDYGDIDALYSSALNMLNKFSAEEKNKIGLKAEKRYSKDVMGKNMIKIYNQLMERH